MDSLGSSLGKYCRRCSYEHSPVTRPSQKSSQLLQILLVRLIEPVLLGTIDIDLGGTS